MMRTALTCFATALFAASLAASEPKKPAPKEDGGATVLSGTPAQQDSPLVRAAKAARKAREAKPSTGPVITDSSVKKSTGRITILSETKEPDAVTPEDARAALAAMKQERTEAGVQAEQARADVESLEGEVARLEKELASIEESYYDESDVELREDLSQRDFAKTKADLETVREKLATARKRHQELERASSNVTRR